MAPPTAPKTLYVNQVATDGWLMAKPQRGANIPLCKYTKLQFIESKQGRTSLTVMDGPHKSEIVSLADANVSMYLGTKAPIQTLIHMEVEYGKYVEGWVSEARGGQKLDQQMATLSVAGLVVNVTMNSVWNAEYAPIPAGAYTVLLPDTPHDANMTRFYRNTEPTLRFDQIWFPIKYKDNGRYVHVGNLSEGCTTVLDLAKWADIEEALISHRGPDGNSVAHLVVKGTPERAK